MATSRISPRGRILLLAGFAALTVTILFATGFDLDLMMVLPALVTAAVLLTWPDPGLGLIMRIAARRPARRPRRHRSNRRRHLPAFARGGRLIAASLGGRAPPAAALRA